MIKHLCNTFPFNMGKHSICTACKAEDCENLTLWLREGGRSPQRFFLKDPSDIEPYSGDNHRLPGNGSSDHRSPYGRMVDLLTFAKSAEAIHIDHIRKEAYMYIFGVDSCHGFNKFGKGNNNQSSNAAGSPHSLQNKAIGMRLFEAAVKNSQVLSDNDKKIKTTNSGKKSYTDGM